MLYEIFKRCKGVSIDSRRVEPGSMFFALRGDNFNGNNYAAAALDAGASYAVVDDESLTGDRYIHVANSLEALQELAHVHRRALGIPIVALTGSNGKTTTKELLLRVLSANFTCRATVGNLNNHIGVPLTLLSLDALIDIGIVEMGANHLHEIEQLCRIAEPNVGLITNVGRAHLEGFGSEEGVERGKGELYDYLSHSSGVAIYNNTDETLKRMVTSRPSLHAIAYDPGAEKLAMNIYGEYNQLNAQAAYAIGRHFGVGDKDARRAILSYLPQNNRSQIVKTERNTLYLDAYNANGSSMRAAIDNFAALEVDSKVVVLGEMRELGQYSDGEHRRVVESLDGRFARVVLIGRNYHQCCGGYEHFECVDSFLESLSEKPIRDSHILIKGSRGVALERAVPYL